MQKTIKGFTIVELLIVIVIIAILAAITIVAYNSIQAKSRNDQTISAVDAYKKGLMAYAAINQTYPSSGGAICLGQPTGGTCRDGTWSENASFDAALRTVMSSLPAPSMGPGTDMSGKNYVPLGFIPATSGVTLDGAPRNFIIFTLESSAGVCPSDAQYTGTWPTLTSGVNPSRSVNCMYALPNPS